MTRPGLMERAAGNGDSGKSGFQSLLRVQFIHRRLNEMACSMAPWVAALGGRGQWSNQPSSGPALAGALQLVVRPGSMKLIHPPGSQLPYAPLRTMLHRPGEAPGVGALPSVAVLGSSLRLPQDIDTRDKFFDIIA
jgi:hypothetical protein